MGIRLAPRRKFIILLLLTLALSAATAGIYLLVSDDTSIPYTVDKYSDALDWCEPSTENGELKIDCKALLLSIKNQEDNSTCFDVQVISNTKELKDLTVCERVGTLTYTSEVASYKILMPVDITFTYTQGLLNRFSFKNVSFSALDDTYVQNIVNEDIANLVTLDPSSTTIQNSVDFCPKPETLPSYVTEENKTKYTEFFSKNILSKERYLDDSLYSLSDNTIKILFACNSAKNMGYSNICNNKTKIKVNLSLRPLIMKSKWRSEMSDIDISSLKEISTIYDNLLLQGGDESKNIEDSILYVFSQLNKEDHSNEDISCSLYNIFNLIIENSKEEYNYIKEAVRANVFDAQSPFCSKILSSEYINKNGLYEKYRYNILNNNNMTILKRCVNLYNYINEI